jgi:hypothetical protein
MSKEKKRVILIEGKNTLASGDAKVQEKNQQ